MTGRKVERKVLLAVREGHIAPRLLAVARALCQRMDADLEILLRAGGETLPQELARFIASLQRDDVAYTLTRKPVLRRRDIVQHANTHECIATVVIDSLEGWENVAQDRSADPWRGLACPLVTAVPRADE
ncbi:MAG: hypothetical protein LDL44_09225 [Caenispirillum sp.]|nr:hypothetical protein [Caenispirillum sp.]